jgi:hypothetical protein
MAKNSLSLIVFLNQFFKGYVIMNIVALPLTLLLTVFIGIMAGRTPHGGLFSHPFLLAAAFIYIAPLLIFACVLLSAKLFDAILRLSPFRNAQVSLPGLLFAAIVVVVLGNIFVDNLYQFRQGQFGLSFVALLMILGFLAVVYACAKIRVPIVSDWFRE